MAEAEEQRLIPEGGAAADPAAKRLVAAVRAFFAGPAVRAALGHAALFAALVVYTVLGGLAFRALERPGEVVRVLAAQTTLWKRRQLFLADVGGAGNATAERHLSAQLNEYEELVRWAAQRGVHRVQKHPPLEEDAALEAGWGFLHSVFFASTVLTTIGYGNVAPVTFSGRFFCVVFALIGIPLTLSVIADLGKAIAGLLGATIEFLKRHSGCARRIAALASPAEDEKESGGGVYKLLSLFGAVGMLIVYIAAGSALFITWEDWDFYEGFYFCFITMTTIGFGDLVPQKADYMLICTVYILVGLALTSTIIELVRRQYAESWQRMRELTARLQTLSGPLTEALKRMDGSGVDVGLLGELRELRKTLTLTQLETRLRFPRSGPPSDWQREVEAAMQQIAKMTAPPKKPQVIYETSV